MYVVCLNVCVHAAYKYCRFWINDLKYNVFSGQFVKLCRCCWYYWLAGIHDQNHWLLRTEIMPWIDLSARQSPSTRITTTVWSEKYATIEPECPINEYHLLTLNQHFILMSPQSSLNCPSSKYFKLLRSHQPVNTCSLTLGQVRNCNFLSAAFLPNKISY